MTDFRVAKTDEELQNALDVEVKNHLYSLALTGWESPAIPLLLALDETLPLVVVCANRSTWHKQANQICIVNPVFIRFNL